MTSSRPISYGRRPPGPPPLRHATPWSAAIESANPLSEYFESNKKRRRIHKWQHYFEIYHRHFAPFRDGRPTVLEFGVAQGGSLQMWKHYFGPGAKIIGIDIDPRCAELDEEGISVVIGDQGDRGFLEDLCERVGPVDVVIDDGGHTMTQQIATFEVMFPRVTERGVYLVEDVHTSYRASYGGGHGRSGTFIEYAKLLIDRLNAWHSEEPELQVDGFTRTADSLTFYDSVVVIQKRPREKPFHRKVGRRSF